MHNTVGFPSASQRKGCGCPRFFVFLFWAKPNAGRQARLEAGAQRTLEAVACTPWLDGAYVAPPEPGSPHALGQDQSPLTKAAGLWTQS